MRLRSGGRAPLRPARAIRPPRRPRRRLRRPKSAAGSACASRGRKAQRSAISTVERERLRQVGEQRRPSRARLEAVLGVSWRRSVFGHQPALGDADQRVMRLVVVARREITARWWRRAGCPAHRRGRAAPARRCARPPCRGAAARHRAGRRTGAAARRSARPRDRAWPAAIAASSGPPGPPVSAIRPSVSPSSQASLRCGCSFGGGLEEGARVQPHQACDSRPRARPAARCAAAAPRPPRPRAGSRPGRRSRPPARSR